MNPQAPIAFVSLHTSHIAGYGDLHEENFARYCTRHGYAYHTYREPPAFLPDGIGANWAKLHLIREHLPHHAFVFWVDADILAIDQSQAIDSTIDGRDFVIGTDHTAWAINSCMIGVRNVAPMRDLVERICARIESFGDRSSVYASGGDQQAIYVELLQSGMIDARHIVDAMTLAASPVYATRQPLRPFSSAAQSLSRSDDAHLGSPEPSAVGASRSAVKGLRNARPFVLKMKDVV